MTTSQQYRSKALESAHLARQSKSLRDSSRPWHPWSNLGSQETNFKMRHYHRVEAVAFLGRSVEK
jgi:hypothetical protein